ncbi:thermonuclease family protein [Agrobacterium tumefaciens]|uniref:Nuclease n=2 Tax=Agrobacterium tumefaciens TaxID=358 RepID=A0A1S7SG17_AGRTU|nr:nuclease [Agrobacterium tumefaciens]NTE95099.1 thermonuclease family protein [Agrobacterium tumefaciens]CUX68642.1 Nuclease [Agrobacterium tumefaciens str. Kerr 14]
MLLMWVAVLTVGVGIYLDRTGGLDRMVALASAPAEDSLSGSFSICGDSRRVNCVVDGDTFWFQSEKIRVADIDTPELSPPRCAAERIKGDAAKARLRVLLSAGRFSMSAGSRDEDQYGRKLRIVIRGGQSLGDVLVAEGLARRWDGARRSWCDD